MREERLSPRAAGLPNEAGDVWEHSPPVIARLHLRFTSIV